RDPTAYVEDKQPRQAREQYLARFQSHLEHVQHSCERLGVTWRQFLTDEPLEHALSTFLRSRTTRGARNRAA
ncbi:MAG: hypothetical protein KY476_24640, partial [Planctomycetes bacterium]|nr:hypothetical protein [Planctomycetota bacterium]